MGIDCQGSKLLAESDDNDLSVYSMSLSPRSSSSTYYSTKSFTANIAIPNYRYRTAGTNWDASRVPDTR